MFSAVGGMELGRHDLAGGPSAPSMLQTPSVGSAGEAVAPPSQGLGQPLSGTKATAADGGSSFGGPAIGDLPFSETPSRTLIVRNVTASSADQDLQQLFEVRSFWLLEAGNVCVNWCFVMSRCRGLVLF